MAQFAAKNNRVESDIRRRLVFEDESFTDLCTWIVDALIAEREHRLLEFHFVGYRNRDFAFQTQSFEDLGALQEIQFYNIRKKIKSKTTYLAG